MFESVRDCSTWTAKAKIVTSGRSPFFSGCSGADPGLHPLRAAVGCRAGAAAYVTVEANTEVEVKLCEGNAAAKSGCTTTWW